MCCWQRSHRYANLDVIQVHVKLSTRSAVAALLDGATPLHAAALRGNPAQIDHLLFCKANPMARTAAGDRPLELVPTCEEQPSGQQLRTKQSMSTVHLYLACAMG